MSNSINLDASKIEYWLLNNIAEEAIKKDLEGKGFDEPTISAYLSEIKAIKAKKRLTNGFVSIGIGTVLGFMGCVISIINPVPELFYWILYSLTPASAILVFGGLYLVFE